MLRSHAKVTIHKRAEWGKEECFILVRHNDGERLKGGAKTTFSKNTNSLDEKCTSPPRFCQHWAAGRLLNREGRFAVRCCGTVIFAAQEKKIYLWM